MTLWGTVASSTRDMGCGPLADNGGEDWGQWMSHQWYGSDDCGFSFMIRDYPSSLVLGSVLMDTPGQDEYTAEGTTNCGD